MGTRITDQFVKKLTIPSSGNKIYFDDQISGFGIRVTANGAKSFIIDYRSTGRQRRLTIGKYPAWSVAAARDEAKDLRKRIDVGRDPMAARHEKRAAPTLNKLADECWEVHFSQLRDAKDIERILNHYIRPALGKHKVAEIVQDDVERWFRESTKRSPARANKARTYLGLIFQYAVKRGYRQANPCRGIRKNPEPKRERFLSPPEIARLVEALKNDRHKTASQAIMFMLLTGCRRGEALRATWDQFDLSSGVWVKPSSHTKQKKEHRVPLSGSALALITQVPRTGHFVFGGHKELDRTPVRRTWRRVLGVSGLSGVRLHDLRHTYASILVSSGHSLPVIGALLGHTQQDTTARYSHLYDDPLRRATEVAGSVILGNNFGEVGQSGEASE